MPPRRSNRYRSSWPGDLSLEPFDVYEEKEVNRTRELVGAATRQKANGQPMGTRPGGLQGWRTPTAAPQPKQPTGSPQQLLTNLQKPPQMRQQEMQNFLSKPTTMKPPPKEGGGGFFNKLKDAIPEPVQTLSRETMRTLDAGTEVVGDAAKMWTTGFGAAPAIAAGLKGRNPLKDEAVRDVWGTTGNLIASRGNPKRFRDTQTEDFRSKPGGQQLAEGLVYDPTNIIGLGAVTRGLKVAGAGAKFGPQAVSKGARITGAILRGAAKANEATDVLQARYAREVVGAGAGAIAGGYIEGDAEGAVKGALAGAVLGRGSRFITKPGMAQFAKTPLFGSSVVPEGGLGERPLKRQELVRLRHDEIKTRPDLFQARDVPEGMDVDPARVRSIVQNFDPNQLEPGMVVHDTSTGDYVVLRGHHRLEAQKQLNATGKGGVGEEGTWEVIDADLSNPQHVAELQENAVRSNYGTAETNIREDIRAFRTLRDAGNSDADIQGKMRKGGQAADDIRFLDVMPDDVIDRLVQEKGWAPTAAEIGRGVLAYGFPDTEVRGLWKRYGPNGSDKLSRTELRETIDQYGRAYQLIRDQPDLPGGGGGTGPRSQILTLIDQIRKAQKDLTTETNKAKTAAAELAGMDDPEIARELEVVKNALDARLARLAERRDSLVDDFARAQAGGWNEPARPDLFDVGRGAGSEIPAGDVAGTAPPEIPPAAAPAAVNPAAAAPSLEGPVAVGDYVRAGNVEGQVAAVYPNELRIVTEDGRNETVALRDMFGEETVVTKIPQPTEQGGLDLEGGSKGFITKSNQEDFLGDVETGGAAPEPVAAVPVPEAEQEPFSTYWQREVDRITQERHGRNFYDWPVVADRSAIDAEVYQAYQQKYPSNAPDGAQQWREAEAARAVEAEAPRERSIGWTEIGPRNWKQKDGWEIEFDPGEGQFIAYDPDGKMAAGRVTWEGITTAVDDLREGGAVAASNVPPELLAFEAEYGKMHGTFRKKLLEVLAREPKARQSGLQLLALKASPSSAQQKLYQSLEAQARAAIAAEPAIEAPPALPETAPPALEVRPKATAADKANPANKPDASIGGKREYGSYSADTIGEKGTVRKPKQRLGQLWVETGGGGKPGERNQDVYRLIPRAEYVSPHPDLPLSYREKTQLPSDHPNRYGYEGTIVKYGGKEYVLADAHATHSHPMITGPDGRNGYDPDWVPRDDDIVRMKDTPYGKAGTSFATDAGGTATSATPATAVETPPPLPGETPAALDVEPERGPADVRVADARLRRQHFINSVDRRPRKGDLVLVETQAAEGELGAQTFRKVYQVHRVQSAGAVGDIGMKNGEGYGTYQVWMPTSPEATARIQPLEGQQFNDVREMMGPEAAIPNTTVPGETAPPPLPAEAPPPLDVPERPPVAAAAPPPPRAEAPPPRAGEPPPPKATPEAAPAEKVKRPDVDLLNTKGRAADIAKAAKDKNVKDRLSQRRGKFRPELRAIERENQRMGERIRKFAQQQADELWAGLRRTGMVIEQRENGWVVVNQGGEAPFTDMIEGATPEGNAVREALTPDQRAVIDDAIFAKEQSLATADHHEVPVQEIETETGDFWSRKVIGKEIGEEMVGRTSAPGTGRVIGGKSTGRRTVREGGEAAGKERTIFREFDEDELADMGIEKGDLEDMGEGELLGEEVSAAIEYDHPVEAFRSSLERVLNMGKDAYLETLIRPLASPKGSKSGFGHRPLAQRHPAFNRLGYGGTVEPNLTKTQQKEAARLADEYGADAAVAYEESLLEDATTTTILRQQPTLFPNDIADEIDAMFAPRRIAESGPGKAIQKIHSYATPARASIDLSFIMNQGLSLLQSSPQNFVKGMNATFQVVKSAVGSPDAYHRLRSSELTRTNELLTEAGVPREEQVGWMIRNGKHYVGDETPKTPIEGGDDFLFPGGAENVPFIGKGIKFSNETFGRFLNYARDVQANDLLERGINKGLRGKELENYVEEGLESVNRATGWTSTRPTDLEGLAVFAPRFFRANIEQIAAAFKPGAEGEVARRHLGKLFILGGVMVAATNEMRDKETVIDPRDPNFMRFRDVGGMDISPFGPYATLIRGVSQMVGGDPYKGFDPLATGLQFGRAKSSPVASTIWSMVTGTNYQGETFDPTTPAGALDAAKKVGIEALPFSVQAGIQEGGLAAALSAIGAQSSRLTPVEKRDFRRDDVAGEMFGQPYDELTGAQKGMVNEDPEIMEHQKDADANALTRAGDKSDAVEQQQELSGQIEALGEQLASGGITGNEFRERYQEIQAELRGVRSVLDLRSRDDEIDGWFGLYDEAADEAGIIDYEELDRLQAEFRTEHPGIDEKVDSITGTHDDATLREYRIARDEASEFYDIPAYRGMSLQESERANELISAANDLVSFGRVPNRTAALAALIANGQATADEIALVRRASSVGGNPERKAFRASHPAFAKFYSDISDLSAFGEGQFFAAASGGGGGGGGGPNITRSSRSGRTTRGRGRGRGG